MTEKMLITKLIRNGNQADLYARGHRYKDTTLFDLSDLSDVIPDYADLPEGEETPCRFWAHYKLGKENSKGTPYKDVVFIEPITPQAPTETTTSGSAQPILDALTLITGELRALRLILLRLSPHPPPAPGNQDPATSGPESAPAGDLASELFAGALPDVGGSDLERFYDLVASGLGDGTLHQDDVDAVQDANLGYDLAADCLRAEMTRRQATTSKERAYRDAVISRLMELHKAPLVTAGSVSVDLPPGWQWTASTDELIEAGKALKESLA